MTAASYIHLNFAFEETFEICIKNAYGLCLYFSDFENIQYNILTACVLNPQRNALHTRLFLFGSLDSRISEFDM